MNITFIMADPNMSGGDRVCAIYAKQLADKGHKVNVIAPVKKTLPFKQQTKRIIKGLGWLSRKAQMQNHFALLDVKVMYCEASQVKTGIGLPDADVVIATWWETAEWVNSYPDSKGKKVYFIQHLETHDYLPKIRVENTYKMNFYMITIARWLVAILEKKFHARDVCLVPNGVSLEAFFAPPRTKQLIPTIGFLYSDITFKGVKTTLKVIKKLKELTPQLRVLCFGITEPESTFPDYIEYLTNPDQDYIRNIYAQCDVWLCCSLSEGFGLTILEAMACRVPAVSTKCGGPEDFIREGENGFLCGIDDVGSLANAVLQILQSSNRDWLALSDAALATAKRYNWNDATDLFEHALNQAIMKAPAQ